MGLEETVLGETDLGTSGWDAVRSSMAETLGQWKWARGYFLQGILQTLRPMTWSEYTWANGR